MHRVLIEPADYQNCRQAVEKAFALFPVDVRGRKVLVKPNVLRACSPEEAVTTHPAVIRAVVDHLETLDPAQIIVGDNPGIHGYGANEACFAKAGLIEAAKGHYRNIGLEGVEKPLDPAYGGRVNISRAVAEADVFISVPKFKTHGLTVLSGAIKNSYGIIPGAPKAKLHRLAGSPERFGEMVVDVFRLRVPDLVIMDAVLGMQGNGPASTELRFIGRILASDNAVALDAVAARMMGADPAALTFLARAKALGLGDHDEAAIETIGELKPIRHFTLPHTGNGHGPGAAAVQAFMDKRIALRPKADPDRCTACGSCVQVCPAEALHMEGAVPVVDADACIACFCCQEMCPEKAISLM